MGRKITFDRRDTPLEPVPPPSAGLTPTDEQEAILAAHATLADLVIEAGAGSGKTSTLRMLAKVNPNLKGIYLAYNKAIAEEAKRTFPDTVQCATAHSFAFRAVGHEYAHRLNGPRLPAWKVGEYLDIPNSQFIWGLPMKSSHAARLAMETVERFCHSADTEITKAHVPYVQGLQPMAKEILDEKLPPLARRAWADLRDPDGRLKFSHDVYLKLWCLRQPQLAADYVLLDEAQDANPAIAQLVERQNRQRILVGDAAQQIYAWRGAVDAMKTFEGVRLPLTRSFRFGPRIANEANAWLRMLAASIRLTGSEIDSRIGPYGDTSAVLCRTNATTVVELMRAIERGVKATLVGSGSQIRALAEAARSLLAKEGTNHPELFMFKTWDEVVEYSQEPAGQDLASFVRLINTHGPTAVIQAIDSMARPEHADVFISTGHKAKGLEWDSVRIATDFKNPIEWRDLTPAEMMLSYVAITRAKNRLNLGSLADDYSSSEEER